MAARRSTFLLATILFFAFAYPTVGQSGFGFGIDVGVAMTPNEVDVSMRMVSILIAGGYELAPDLVAEGTIGLTYVRLQRSDFPEDASLDPANIMLGIRKRHVHLFGAVNGELSFHSAVPLALLRGDLTEKRLTETNYFTAASAAGWRDPFPWLLNTLPLLIGVQAQSVLTEGTTLRCALRPAYLISLNEYDSRAALSTELSIEQQLLDKLNVHAGVSCWASTQSLENNDRVQSSMFLELRLHTEGHLFGLGVNVNLDAPYGVIAREKKTEWGLMLQYR